MALPEPLSEALSRPEGARFRRCALQVNPFPYLQRPGQRTSYPDEGAYNAALVEACVTHGVELLGVTDHDSADDAGLRAAAREAGIVAFPGMELCSSEGVHVLVLFDPDVEQQRLRDFLGWCGVDRSTGPAGGCRPCQRTLEELLAEAPRRGAVTLAPHAVSGKGLLRELNGQPLANIWRDPNLLAVAVPGSVEDLDLPQRHIVQGKDANFARGTQIAVVNAQDVSDPTDLSNPRTWTWVKTATDSIEGLRQAFLDPESRVRLSSDPVPEEHSELLAIAWDGGFFDGCRMRLNENFNVLIGGRGAGKSTVVESLRYVLGLEPIGDLTARAHKGFVDKVLGEGTTVRLLVRSTKPDDRRYLIQRTVPSPPEVLSEIGERLSLQPGDVLPQAEIYGQHEIAELAGRRERRTVLLDRFMPDDPGAESERTRLRRELARSREQLEGLLRDRDALDEDLARLPGLEEQLRRFEDSGIEERLQQQAQFTREGTIFDRVKELVGDVDERVDALREAIPFDREFLSDKAIEGLPSADLLRQTNDALADFERDIEAVCKQLADEASKARERVDQVRGEWDSRRARAQQAYEAALRQLGAAANEGRTFVELRRTVERLQPLRGRRERVESALETARKERDGLLQELADLRRQTTDAYRDAAKKVSKELRGLVRVTFRAGADRTSVVDLLRDEIGGRLDTVQQAIEEAGEFSPAELARRCRQGGEALRDYLPGATHNQVERVCERLDEPALMRLEEVELADALDVELNVGSAGQPQWRELDELSTGQKATAVLLLLLLESHEPLVVDQPEDDLDNAFISEGVVPRIRRSKRQRQFLFTTHNANIPVLGDAELIAVVRAMGDVDGGQGDIDVDETGSIDSPRVRDLVEELLEGGREAFETRRRKYQF